MGSVTKPTSICSTLFINTRHASSTFMNDIKSRVEIVEMLPDFVVSDICIVLLELSSHLLRPRCFNDTLSLVLPGYKQKILLLHVDDCNALNMLFDLNKQCISNSFILICAFAPYEVRLYIETLSLASGAWTRKGVIHSASEKDHFSQSSYVISGIKRVGSNDLIALCRNFTCIRNVFQAKEEMLEMIPGIGSTKVLRILQACSKPFVSKPPISFEK